MENIKKRSVFLVLSMLLSFVGCSFDYSQPSQPEYNDIDAVTSASDDIQVTGGRAYAESAVLKTYHKDTYKLHWIEYGTTLSYGNNILVADTPRVQSITISNLKSNTKYYFNFNGARPGEGKAIHNVQGIFTTVSATSLVFAPVKFNISAQNHMLLIQNRLVLNKKLKIGDLLAIRTIQGKITFSGLINRGNGNSIILPKLSACAYVVQYIREFLSIDSSPNSSEITRPLTESLF